MDKIENKLPPLKLETPDKFGDFLRVLSLELYWANFYYDIFKEINGYCKKHEEAMNFSPTFWSFTLRAHFQTTLLHLHRIYDQNKESFNLHRFLLTVRDNREIFDLAEVRRRRQTDPHAEDLIKSIGALDLVQLERDIEFSSRKNLKVENLKTWRDRVTFHKDERELFRQKPFEEDYPLLYCDVDELLKKAFEMLNRYSQYFDTTIFSLGCREWKDMEFVFESLEHHPFIIRKRAQDAALAAMGLS